MKKQGESGKAFTEEEYRDLALAGQPLKPLRELLGLVSPLPASPTPPRHLFYVAVDTSAYPGPSMRNRRKGKWRKKKEKKMSNDENDDEAPVASFGFTPNISRITTDNLARHTSPSSSIFSSPTQVDIPPIPQIQSEDIIPSTEPQDAICPALPQDPHSHVQSNDISSCSEVEAFLGASQQPPARKRVRKRRRITTKLSLSQNSNRQDQSSQASDNVQLLTEVLHIASSDSDSTSTTTNDTQTNTGTNTNPKPSTSSNISMQEASLDSQSLLAPTVVRGVHQPAKPPSCRTNSLHTNTSTNRNPDKSMRHKASFKSQNMLAPFLATNVQQPAKPTKQSEAVHTLDHRRAWLPKQGIKAGTVKAIHVSDVHRQHMRNRAGASQERQVTFQSPVVHVDRGSDGCCEPDSQAKPQVLSAGWQDTTLTSTTDSDQSVYYEAPTHLTILDESCAGPSGVENNPQPPAGPTLPPITLRGDADTSSSSFSQRESDYTSHSFSSSGSSTYVAASLLNKTVITNKQSAATFKRPVEDTYKDKNHPADQKQIKRHKPQSNRLPDKGQLNPQPGTSGKDSARGGWSKERRQRQDHREVWPPHQGIGRPQQAMEDEVSSSTSDPHSDGELSVQHIQGAKIPLPMKPASGLEGSVVSSSSCSSSSSSSSVLLTEEGMGCIQTIGNVFKHFFGGTVEDNLSLIQRNNYNLLQCLIELQAAPHPNSATQPNSPSSPPPAPP